MSAPKRLGRGLDALLKSQPRRVSESVAASTDTLKAMDLAVAVLKPGRYQPRQNVSDDALAELADSIREQGVLQPLVVRPLSPEGAAAATHEIVAGERRWRAARLVGLETIPVVVRDLDDQSALAVALIENLQREDLNPIEQARSLLRLAEEFGLTHQQVADAVGRSRSSVSNTLRLLDLDDEVKSMLAGSRLDMGHARALLPLEPRQQVAIAQQADRAGWSVRQVETAVRGQLDPERSGRGSKSPSVDMQTRWLQQQFGKELGHKVALRPAKNGHYRLDIGFSDLEQLQALLGNIQSLVRQVSATAGPRAREQQD